MVNVKVDPQTCIRCQNTFVVYRPKLPFVCAGCHPFMQPPRRRVVEMHAQRKATQHGE